MLYNFIVYGKNYSFTVDAESEMEAIQKGKDRLMFENRLDLLTHPCSAYPVSAEPSAFPPEPPPPMPPGSFFHMPNQPGEPNHVQGNIFDEHFQEKDSGSNNLDSGMTNAQIALQDAIDSIISSYFNEMIDLYNAYSNQHLPPFKHDAIKITQVRLLTEKLLNLPNLY